MWSLYVDTLRGLVAPRRAIPISLVCAPMVLAQDHFTRGHPTSVALAVGMCFAFVGTAPFSWRALFPTSGPRFGWVPSLLLYGLMGGLPAVLGFFLPSVLGLGQTFLTGSVNLLVAATLFWVGGWGLARDIDQEQGLQRAVAQAEAARRAVEEAQNLALRAHLNPHFLFNTLNAIAEWCREDPLVAERALLDLSVLLRDVLGGATVSRWSVTREVEVARRVWSLHQTRDAGRFDPHIDLPDDLPDVDIPPLLLLPLVENAVTHGPAKGHRGPLHLAVSATADAAVFTISNPGSFGKARADSSGLDTVRRILAMSNPRATLAVEAVQNRVVATLIWPTAQQPGR